MFRFRTSACFAATLALAAFALPAAAQVRLELQAGRSSMGSVGKNGTDVAFIDLIFKEFQIGNSRFSWAPEASAGWIGGRNYSKRYLRYYPNYTVTHDVGLVAGGARFRYGGPDDWYHHFFFSEQIAGQPGNRTQALSTHYQFVSSAGVQWQMLSFQVRHISNGSTGGPNRGETMALLGVGWDF